MVQCRTSGVVLSYFDYVGHDTPLLSGKIIHAIKVRFSILGFTLCRYMRASI